MVTNITNRAEEMAAYINNTRVNSRDAVALALQLDCCAPADITPDERSSLQVVKDMAKEVQRIRESRVRASPSALREPRNAASMAITALSDGLRAVASAPAEVGPEGAQATAIIDAVLPEGTGYTKLHATGLWSGLNVALERIDEGGLAPQIDALLSPALLRAVRAAHQRLGRAIKVSGQVVPAMPKSALVDANAKFSFAVATYARTLSVAVKLDDEASFARFIAAVAPIDGSRVTRGDGEEEEDDDVEEPEVASPTAPIPPGLPGADPFVRS